MPSPPTPTPTPEDHHRTALRELLEIGMDIARDLRDQVKLATIQDPAAAFDRIARAIRRTILLDRRLAEASAQPQPASPDPARQRTQARTRIVREVEASIHRDTEGPAATALRAELRERLDAPELDDDIADRPIDEIIQDIRRDLGLADTRHWPRRTPAEAALLTQIATAPQGQATSLPNPPPKPRPKPDRAGRAPQGNEALALHLARR